MRKKISATAKTAMTRYEKASFAVSLCAVVIAILSALVSPWASVHLFNTADKEFDQRGILVQVDSGMVVDLEEKLLPYDFEIWADFVNAGSRPVAKIHVFIPLAGQDSDISPPTLRERVFGPPDKNNFIEAVFPERQVEFSKKTSTHSVYLMDGPLAPGRTLRVTYRMKQNVELIGGKTGIVILITEPDGQVVSMTSAGNALANRR